MTCDESQAALIGSLFGELEPGAGIALHFHLDSCPSCRGEQERLIALRQAIQGSTAPPSTALRERIRRALPARLPAPATRWFGRPVPAYVAIGAALLGAAAAFATMRAGAPMIPEIETTAPVASPLARDASRFFTAAGCYTTGVDSALRSELFGDSTTRRRESGEDSL